MRIVKELWQRFRQWQQEPLHYKPLTDEKHVCLNCKQEFAGMFCPRCGQKALTEEHVGWKSLKDDIFVTFDLEQGVLFRTFWHLLWRPGYLINDYLSGKRKICTSPVNTLIMIGVVFVLVRSLFGIGFSNDISFQSLSVEGRNILENINNWSEQNKGWYYLILCLFFTIPTWVLFRHSPRHPRHTLVEGFFIQVFVFIIFLMFELLFMILGEKPRMFFSVVLFFYFVFTLGPVFGYNWWSTLWRSVLVMITASLMQFMIPLLIGAIVEYHSVAGFFLILFLFLCFSSVILVAGYMIGRRTERRRKAASKN